MFLLHFHLCLDRPSDLTLPVSPTIMLYTFPIPSYLLSAKPALFSVVLSMSFDAEAQIMKLLIVYFCPHLNGAIFCLLCPAILFSTLRHHQSSPFSQNKRSPKIHPYKIRYMVTMLRICTTLVGF